MIESEPPRLAKERGQGGEVGRHACREDFFSFHIFLLASSYRSA